MSEVLNVSVLQTNVIWHEKEKNLANISQLVDNAPSVCDLLLLPEMFTTGFSMSTDEYAEEMFGDTHQFLINLATDHNICIAGSVMITHNGQFYNRLLLVKPGGATYTYDKRHLFQMGMEDTRYQKGDERIIVEINGFKILPLICYDLRFPVWSRNNNEYDIALYISNWPKARIHAWDTLLAARAIENQAYVIGVNRVGTDKNHIEYNGRSKIIDPKGQVIIEAGEHEKIISTTLYKEKLDNFRKKFPTLNDRDEFVIIT